jgi:hypothetical protein
MIEFSWLPQSVNQKLHLPLAAMEWTALKLRKGMSILRTLQVEPH